MVRWFGANSSFNPIAGPFARFDWLDRRGEAWTFFALLLWCIAGIGPRSLVELGHIPLCAIVLIRLAYVLVKDRTTGIAALRASVGGPIYAVVVVWILWLLLSLTWSLAPTHSQGWQEVSNGRWALVLIPAIALCGPRALRAGVVTLSIALCIAAVAVLAEFVAARWLNVGTLRDKFIWSHPPEPGNTFTRFSGWWNQPAVGGAMLVASLGLTFPAILRARTPTASRVVATLMVLVSLGALILTGARGAWISAAATICLITGWSVCSLAFRRNGTRSSVFKPLLISVAASLIAVAAVATIPSVRQMVEARVREGIREVTDFHAGRDVNSFTGTRLAMARWAIIAARERPITGVGAGAFAPFVRQHLADRGVDPESRRVMSQAHNTALHALATTGVVGFGLLATLVGLSVRAAWRAERDEGVLSSWLPASPAWALIALTLHSAFDTIYVNQSTAALATTLVAFAAAGGAMALRPDAR